MQRGLKGVLLPLFLVLPRIWAREGRCRERETAALNQRTTLVSTSLIMGKPDSAMDGGYQELGEGRYTRPELTPGNQMFAPVRDIFERLGGHCQPTSGG